MPPVPDDFAAVAPTMGRKELRAHYRTGCRAIRVWCELSGVDPKPPADLRRLAPEDFGNVAVGLGQEGLIAHYKASATSIARWIAEMPDDWKRTRRGNLRGGTPAAAKPRVTKVRKGRGPSMEAKFDNERKRTNADLAAMHLQRRFVPVVRATIYGKQYAGLWQVGRLKMAEADMVALARKQGWAA